jgi:HTH-type transcriptional regulator/antitoxin HigA
LADIHPIRTESDYERALQEIAALIEKDPTPDIHEGEHLELLALVVQDYEAKNYPIPAPDDPVEVILFYMKKNGLSRKDMEAFLGDKARVSDILNGRPSLSLAMIRRLSQGPGIPTDLLIAPNRCSQRQQPGGARVYSVP